MNSGTATPGTTTVTPAVATAPTSPVVTPSSSEEKKIQAVATVIKNRVLAKAENALAEARKDGITRAPSWTEQMQALYQARALGKAANQFVEGVSGVRDGLFTAWKTFSMG